MRRFFKGKPAAASNSKSPWRSPDHPPYSQMVEVALRALSEEGGSTEASISAYMQSIFTDLPWGHDRLLPYYLGKLVDSGELCTPSQDHYQLSLHRPPFLSTPSFVRSRGRSALYRSNSLYPPSFDLLPSVPPRRRDCTRGRSKKHLAECRSELHLEQGSVPLRPRRGRPPIRRGAIARASSQRLVPRIRKSRGSRIILDGFRIRNLSRNPAFCDDKNSGGDMSTALDSPQRFELIYSQSAPGNMQQLLSHEQFSPIKGPLQLPDFSEPSERRSSYNADMFHVSSSISTLSNDKKNGGSETFLLDCPEQPEYANGGEQLQIVPAQLSECGEGQFLPVSEVTPEAVKSSSFLAPELSDQGEEKSPQGETNPSLVPEQAEVFQEGTSPGEELPLLSPEKQENDDHKPEKPEDGHEKSPGEVTALVSLPVLDGDVVESSVLSSKQKKARRRRNRLKLWFEGIWLFHKKTDYQRKYWLLFG